MQGLPGGGVIRVVLAYFLIRGLNGLVGIASLAILTRMLSPQEYGQYALGITAIGLVATIAFQWLVVSYARYFPAHKAEPAPLFASTRRLFVRTAIGVCAAALLVALGRYEADRTFILVVLAGAISLGWFNLSVQEANSNSDPRTYGWLTLSKGVLAIAAVYLATSFDWSVNSTLLLATLAPAIAALTFLRRGYVKRGGPVPVDPSLSPTLIRFGLPVALASICTALLDSTDRFILHGFVGPEAVGRYAAAYDLTQQTVGAVSNVFFLVWFPRVVHAWSAHAIEDARREVKNLKGGLFWMAPALLGIYIGMPDVIAMLVLGPGVAEYAAELLPWTAAAVFSANLGTFLFGISFQVQKRTRVQLAVSLFMLITNIGMSFLLVPSLGPKGAAYSICLAFSVGCVVSWALTVRDVMMPPILFDFAKAWLITGCAAYVCAWTAAVCGRLDAPVWLVFVVGLLTVALVSTLMAFVLNVSDARVAFVTFIRKRA